MSLSASWLLNDVTAVTCAVNATSQAFQDPLLDEPRQRNPNGARIDVESGRRGNQRSDADFHVWCRIEQRQHEFRRRQIEVRSGFGHRPQNITPFDPYRKKV